MNTIKAPADLAAEALVETLTDLVTTARVIADGLDGTDTEHVRHLPDVADQCARMAAVANMQREELEAKFAEQERLMVEFLATCRGGGAGALDRMH